MEAITYNSPSILIVDDNPINAKLLSYWCTKWGYLSEIVLSGKAALNKAASTDYTLAIMDILLPDISGIDVCKELTSYQPNLEVVFQSGLSEEEFRSMDGGGHYFLQKPYYPNKMEEIVDFIFQKHAIKIFA